MGRRRIRLCQFTPTLWSGGTEERLARVMSAMDRQEFELSWIGFGPVREALIERGGRNIDVVPILRDVGGGIEPWLIVRIARHLRRLRPDVMHIHNWSTSLYGIAAARLAGVPTVLFGIGGQDNTDPPPARRQAAMRALAPHVDRFTAVCDWLANDIATYWDVPRDRIDVLRTGIDLQPIDNAPDRRTVRDRLGIPLDAIVVGTISVLRPVKRIPDLIEAVGELAAGRPNLHLLLVGNPLGVSPTELRHQAEACGIGGRFHLIGRVEQPAHTLPAFDVFVNCSVFEGTSNAILEAMASRIPIVATAVGGTPELVVDGREGRLVPPEAPAELAAALRDFIEDGDKRAAAGLAGRAHVEAFHTFDRMIDGYLENYRRAAAIGAVELRERAVRAARSTWETARRMAAS